MQPAHKRGGGAAGRCRLPVCAHHPAAAACSLQPLPLRAHCGDAGGAQRRALGAKVVHPRPRRLGARVSPRTSARRSGAPAHLRRRVLCFPAVFPSANWGVLRGPAPTGVAAATTLRKGPHPPAQTDRPRSYVMPDLKTAYMTDDGTNVGFFMFKADRRGDLSRGACRSGVTSSSWAGTTARARRRAAPAPTPAPSPPSRRHPVCRQDDPAVRRERRQVRHPVDPPGPRCVRLHAAAARAVPPRLPPPCPSARPPAYHPCYTQKPLAPLLQARTARCRRWARAPSSATYLRRVGLLGLQQLSSAHAAPLGGTDALQRCRPAPWPRPADALPPHFPALLQPLPCPRHRPLPARSRL